MKYLIPLLFVALFASSCAPELPEAKLAKVDSLELTIDSIFDELSSYDSTDIADKAVVFY